MLMIDEKTKKILDQLSEKLKTYSDAYYNGQPLVSDQEYDKLFQRLQLW